MERPNEYKIEYVAVQMSHIKLPTLPQKVLTRVRAFAMKAEWYGLQRRFLPVLPNLR
jgi:hypothetical protein